MSFRNSAPYEAAPLHEISGRRFLIAEDAVHMLGKAIAGAASIDHEHPAPGPAEEEGCGQARGSAADHDRIPC